MRKISNSVTGRTVLPAVGAVSYLTFASVSQAVFAAATIALTRAAYVAWIAANPTFRPITLTQIIGNDGVPKLLAEYTTEAVSEPLNSLITTTIITGADAPALVQALQDWKDANTLQKIIRVTQLTGLDGGVGLLVEYGIDSSITNLVNTQISQTFFQDAGEENTSYQQYVDWKAARKIYDAKPYRLTYVIASDGGVGLLVEYTPLGSSPSISQIQLAFVVNTFIDGDVPRVFAKTLQDNKTAYPNSQIYRVTPVFQGFIIESTLNGTTPANILVSQSAYSANTGASDATDAYQVFKTANPTLKPIRLTAMTWGDGTNTIVAEYIS